eukprot:CAMPEP_0197528588 /NCGR_PEP_ID=MMETSP1318-20131121/25636_1 /TAXON_ID=552666 /ORGANISM="Partenskyella glossopodia, Strain RCC365" /LENGTH=480 /DNA_ID=CAMNT_0043083743 /DNA_START=96 /DNA_END=1538 /DNA_ORIENTATION=-
MTYVLRHKAEAMGLRMREDGYVLLTEMLQLPAFKKFPQHEKSLENIQDIVDKCPKQRFSLKKEGMEYWIRANQGHSIKALDDSKMLKKLTDPSQVNCCVHGTYWDAFEIIRESGLNRMSRKHIHFSTEEFGSKDMISGMRSSCQVLIHLNIQKCLTDDIPLYLSANSVVLSDGEKGSGIISPEYFSRVDRIVSDNTTKKKSIEDLKDWKTCPIPKNAKKHPKSAQLRIENKQSNKMQIPDEGVVGGSGVGKPDYLCVLDFEATCEKDVRIETPEIIEFPSVLVDVKEKKIVSHFAKYVKPEVNRKLSEFCTELTGIKQETVDQGVSFPVVVKLHSEWLKDQTKGGNFIFVTCGDWDLRSMIKKQCRTSGMKIPSHLRRWGNIKDLYAELYKRKAFGMANMLDELEMKLEGRHHSGIDDCKNIARIAIRMMNDGCEFRVTGSTDKSHKKLRKMHSGGGRGGSWRGGSGRGGSRGRSSGGWK